MKIKLYHFSDCIFKTLKPSFFGKNCYSRNEAQASSLPRAFCYNTPRPQEALLHGASFRYTLEIEAGKIYDLDKDSRGLKEKLAFNIDSILKAIIKAGFKGASYQTSFKTFILFKGQAVSKTESLYKGNYRINQGRGKT